MSQSCANCGARISEGASFCDNCGTPVSEKQPIQEAPTRQEAPARPTVSAPPATSPRETDPREAPARRQGPLGEKTPEPRAPTPPVPPVPPRVPPQRPPAYTPPQREERSRGRLFLVIGAGLVVALVAMGLAAWFLFPYLQGGGEAERLEVPSLEGRTLEEARAIVGEDFELVGDGEPGDIVGGQDPGPGERVTRGSEISVSLSGAVPDVVGMPRDEAEETLSAAGFEVEVEEGGDGPAGEVLEQDPAGGGETGEGSKVAITVGADGAEPGYASVADGALRVEVPPGWENITGGESETGGLSWSSFLGGSVGASITAAPDLEAWGASATTGAYVVASKALAQGYTNEQLVTSGPNDLSDVCTPGTAQDFEEGAFPARVQLWKDCGGNPDLYFYAVAAAPEDRECAVVMQLGGFGVPERDIAQHLIDTFEVDCAALAA